ncbi:MAG: hypothetical protein JF606_17260 [Burkholderiales bacterium]|nr:hypothetical protein [Burkholderiales bacterium]
MQSTGGRRSGRVAAQDAPGGASRPRVGATIRTAIVVEDTETGRSRQRARVGAAQRLGNSGWLSTGDIIDFTKAIAAEIAGKPGAERIGFADPSQIQLLLEGDIKAQADVRSRLVDDGAPPILFVPVHGSGNHWSLLAIDRHANHVYHYDSMVPPDMAHCPPATEQFKQAKTVADLLQVGTPVGAPIHQQIDGHSCGDHVLYGMRVLARRMLAAERFSSINVDLRDIEPDRRSVLDVLTRIEAAPAPQAPSGSDSFADTETAIAPLQEPVWASVPRVMPSFDADAAGSNWVHGRQIAPQWLLQRGIHDGQIVRICNMEYRVAAIADAWGRPQVWLHPHLQGD